ncbi:MAG: hypothetical protein FWG87_09325 [Defluviitaleaceae bacterium]|nr:hypothetical protein [Defluviitaleaceae bacterium]
MSHAETVQYTGLVTSINAERGNLGTDKSVPYETVRGTQKPCKIRKNRVWDVKTAQDTQKPCDMCKNRTCFVFFVGEGFIPPEVRT